MSGEIADLGRFTDVALLVLLSLANGAPKHGYAMIEDIQTFSGVLLEPGTLYGALMRLEKQGWIAPQPTEERRRPYIITDSGRTALNAGLTTLRRIVVTGDARGALA
jgi:DNA-binding PadR family transcriptional regulator